jgi:catechol 2,3-dioxygenase-like lactoylglutathione lyase family enzyme
MASRFSEVVVDCRDPRRLAEFWCGVLGYEIIDETPGGPVEIAGEEQTPEAMRRGAVPPTIIFLVVPEPKTVKNRLHIDVRPVDRTTAAEVERIVALGARRVDIGQGEQAWTVLADPEGNEFCVLRELPTEG